MGECPFWRGHGPPSHYNVAWAEAYFCTKWYPDASSRLVTIDMGRKLGAVPPILGGAWSSSNIKSPEPRLTSIPSGILIHPAVWPQRTQAEKLGAVNLMGELGPHLIQCGRPRPTCMPSLILIRPTVWPQYTNVRDRTDRATVR